MSTTPLETWDVWDPRSYPPPLLVRRRRWAGAVLGAMAVRLVLDPRAQTYYTSDVVVAAVVADLWLTQRRFPWFAIGAIVLLYAVLPIGTGAHALGLLRVVYCVATAGILLIAPRLRQAR